MVLSTALWRGDGFLRFWVGREGLGILEERLKRKFEVLEGEWTYPLEETPEKTRCSYFLEVP